MYHNNTFYQAKPMSTDSQRTAGYISVGYDQNVGYQGLDEINMWVLKMHMAHTFENFNLSYGAYGFTGNYNNKTTLPGPVDNVENVGNAYFTNKATSGFGLNTSANYYIRSGRTDIRIIGLELGYNNESGDYLNYRRSASSLPNIFTDPSSNIFTAGLNSEIIWHNKKDPSIQYGFKLYMGTVFGDHTYVNTNSSNTIGNFNATTLDGSFSFFFQLKRYFLVFDGNNGVTWSLGLKL